MKTFQIWPWKTPPPPTMTVLWFYLSMERFIHLRLQQRLSLCPLGNNLATLGLHGEQFQKDHRELFFQHFKQTATCNGEFALRKPRGLETASGDGNLGAGASRQHGWRVRGCFGKSLV
ncbi:hypothetical protein GmHk_15G045014 [Glycine max]|nr:hypothetical protein GmHk_15G045014 [Glycine max]